MHHHDIFSGFFGGAAGLLSSAESMLQHALNPRSDDITVPLEVSLSDVFLGKTKQVILERKKGCTGCRGGGQVMTRCRACQGNGISMTTIQPFPGYIQQVPQECRLCRGSGFAGHGNCPTCHGQGAMIEKRKLDVKIPTNCRTNQELCFNGYGHHMPGEEAGDAVVVFSVQDHPVFQRRGAHLFLERDVTLSEALCGVEIPISTLDGRSLLIRNKTHNPIKPFSVRVIENEGMPVHPSLQTSSHHPVNSHGNLYIKFTVKFPSELDKNVLEILKSLLPGVTPPLDIDRMREDVEEVQLSEYNPNEDTHLNDMGSDDDLDHHPSAVQCVHQ